MVGPEGQVGLVHEPEAGLGNLPVAGEPLFGRDGALEELRSSIWQTRLLSLTGPGGVGKSRLAAALAAAVRDDFVGGAWWADLSDSGDPGRVAQDVASAILPGAPVADPEAALSRRLTAPSLLVLDNCDEVVPGVANLVLDLLADHPALRVLVTTVEPLGIQGEYAWPVPGLVVEGFSSIVGGDDRDTESAIALFNERAQAAAGTFQPGYAGTREAIAEICLWLDGMPLAIELVAARVAALSVSQIAERFKREADRQRHVDGLPHGRHRSMQDTLEWCHQLLDSTDQLLFRRLAVFRGGFSAGAVEAVCADELLPEGQLEDLIALFVRRGLVQAYDSLDGRRYQMQATVRAFAAGKLEGSGELAAARKRHAAYYVGLARAARAGLGRGDHARWAATVELEHPNLRHAMHWLFEYRPTEAAGLASNLWPFQFQRGHYSEARAWLERALGCEPQLAPAAATDLLLDAGEVAFLQSDYAAAVAYLRRALRAAGSDGNHYAEGTAVQRLGSIAREQGRYEESRALHERSAAIWRALGDRGAIAASDNYLAFAGWLSRDFELTESAGSRALEGFDKSGSQADVAVALVNLGTGSMYGGAPETARQRLEKALSISRRLGFEEGVAWSSHELAILARRERRQLREHQLMLRDVLLIHQQLGDRWRTASALEEIADGVFVSRDPALAASLLGCAQALRDRIGTPVSPAEAPDRQAAIAQLHERLDAKAFDAAWSHGRALQLPRAIEIAVAAIEQLESGATSNGSTPILTQREQAVLELIGRGFTNREIGATLHISPSTAGVHCADVARKLGVKLRGEVVARAETLGLLSAG